MISIILCVGNQQQLLDVSKNIEATIGVPYELVTFPNEDGRMGMCEVYNKGIARAKYDMLCFMHIDLEIHTPNWGQIVLNIFSSHPDLGLLGVAGGYYKALTPSGWLSRGIDTECSNLIQAYKFVQKPSHLHYKNPFNTRLAEVATLDGLWLCVPKAIAVKARFDDQRYKGFHCYDVDFSLAVGISHKVAVTYDILMTHFSEGCFDIKWLRPTLALQQKWKDILFVNKGPLQKKEIIFIEKTTFKHFLSQLHECKMPKSTAFKVLWTLPFISRLGLSWFLKMNYYTFKSYFVKPAKA